MKSKSIPVKLYVEWFTVKAKKSVVSVPNPDLHIVNVVATLADGGAVSVREFTFPEKDAAKNHYDHLKKNVFRIA